MEERHLSLSEAADALDISERTAYRWIKSGKLRAYKPGRDYWIPESAIKEVVEKSEVRPKALRRSSPEPSLFNGLEDERHSEAAEAIFGLMERWHARRLAEVDDSNSPHFRDATSAALWIAETREEAQDLCEWLADFLASRANNVGALQDALYLFAGALALDGPAGAGEMRLQEMADKPDDLAARRLQRATAEEKASMERLQELRKAANG